MPPSITLFLLRAYGDFVIALNVVSRTASRENIQLVASVHLEPLYKAIQPFLPAPVEVQFVDFGIQKQLMRCFTNKYMIHPHAVKELNALRNYLHERHITDNIFLEQKKRIWIPRLFCNYPFRSVVSDGPVYRSYADFFSVPFQTLEAIPYEREKKGQQILIVPDARQALRRINTDLIQEIEEKYRYHGASVKVAYFRKKQEPAIENAAVYNDFRELIRLIEESDWLIGSDSLPVHIAQLLGKPHCILYPRSLITTRFFTPFALKNETYIAFEDLKSRKNFFNE